MYNYKILFTEVISDRNKCLAWCQKNGLIMDRPGCQLCGRVMSFYQPKKKKNAEFLCNGVPGNRHSVKISAQKHSWFEQGRDIENIIIICYMFSVGETSYLRINREISSDDATRLSSRMISNWLVHCREVVLDWCLSHQAESLGGPGKVVLVHRSKIMAHNFRKLKDIAKDAWLFELVDLGGDDLDDNDSEFKVEKFKLILLSDDRVDTETLLPYLKEFILPNTVLFSDLWKGKYYFLGENSIQPYQVQEKKKVDRSDVAQINWQKIKNRLSTGIRTDHHVYEFIWRRFVFLNKLDSFEFLINCIKTLYNPYANNSKAMLIPNLLSEVESSSVSNEEQQPLRKKLKTDGHGGGKLILIREISKNGSETSEIPVAKEVTLNSAMTS